MTQKFTKNISYNNNSMHFAIITWSYTNSLATSFMQGVWFYVYGGVVVIAAVALSVPHYTASFATFTSLDNAVSSTWLYSTSVGLSLSKSSASVRWQLFGSAQYLHEIHKRGSVEGLTVITAARRNGRVPIRPQGRPRTKTAAGCNGRWPIRPRAKPAFIVGMEIRPRLRINKHNG